MKTSLEWKITLGFGVSVAMLLVLGIVSHRSVNQFIASAEWNDHTRQVLLTIAEIDDGITEAETNSRGYAISGDSDYIRDWEIAVARVEPAVQEVRSLTVDNAHQQERLDRVEGLLKDKVAVMRQTVEIRRDQGFDAAQRLIQAGKSQKTMMALQKTLGEMKDEERRLLAERAAEEQAIARRTIAIITCGSAFGFIVVSLAGWMIRRDIVARRRIEQALRDSEEQYRFLADSMPQIIWRAGPDGALNYYNVRWYEYTGTTFEQAKDAGWKAVFHPEDLEACANLWMECVRSGKAFEGEYRIRSAAGEFRWHLCRGLSRRDEQGNIFQWFGTCTDIDDFKRAEEAVRVAEERFRLLIDSVRDYAIFMLDVDGNVASWNGGAQRINGYSAEEVIGRHFSTFYTAEDIENGKPARELKIATEQGRYEEEGWRLRKDGSQIWANVVISPVRDETGRLRGFSKVTRDVTERKRAQDNILDLNKSLEQHSAQLEAANKELEAFSYSVSHDLRAPLRSIDGFSQALLEDYGDKIDESGKDSLNRVRAATQRMGQLIDDMLNLSRVTRSEMRPERVDLSAMAAAVVAELQKNQPDRSVAVIIPSGLATYGDLRLLRVVLDNLLGNAWKFTTKRNDARIEFGICSDGGFFVRDNGAGFDMAYSQKLFGAFQRLHAMNEFAGTGIGLATVQRIIHRHGGRVRAEGEVNKGATFYFTIGSSPAMVSKAA